MAIKWVKGAVAGFLAFIAMFGDTTVGFATEAVSERPLAVYATQMASPNTNTAFIEATHKVLSEAFWPRKVIFEMLPIAELDKIVNQRKADVVMAGAGFYRRHLHEGLRDIATVVSPLQPNPDRAVGSTIVTLKSRSDINTLADLKGKTVSANAPIGFQGILIVKNELSRAGYNPDKFFGKTQYVGMDLLPSVEMLREGKIDAAILTSCLMEESAARGDQWPNELKVINEKPQKDVACRVSTRLYPNWSILLTPAADLATTRKVVAAVHAMPRSPEGIEWAVATDFGPVDEMYKELKIGPYAYLRELTLGRIISEYGPWLVVFFFIIAGLVAHSVLISYLVRKRTKLLSDSLERQKEQGILIAQLSERYELVRRAAAVSQISSIIAHELSQPLAGIVLYAEGLKNLLFSSRIKPVSERDALSECIDKISARAQKANDIVQSVRNLAKNKSSDQKRLDLCALICELRHDFSLTSAGRKANIKVQVPAAPCPISGNAFEIKLALLNLLRNSSQAPRTEPLCQINIGMDVTDSGNYLLRITDNGSPISSDLLTRLNDPVVSLKSDGLGLGLSIVRSIVEAHFGKLSFCQSRTGGLEVRMLLPSSMQREDSSQKQ